MRKVVLLVALTLAVMAEPSFAQQVLTDASLSGTVTDPSDAVVPGAHVVARQIETNQVNEAITDPGGRFRFSHLRIGPYEVTFRLAGFADATRRLTLNIGAAFELPVSLRVGALDATVTVSGQATIVEAARTQVAGTVLQPEVRSTPMNGRNFLDLALLVPGVSPTNVNSTQLFAETSAVPGSGISVGSQRNLSNNFIVDGLSANDDAAALSGLPYGVDAIDQFQVVTSGGQAELGRALGGYVSVVTRTGTNTLSGDLYGYFRDDRFNAKNALSATKLPMSQQQYGAAVGGPFVRDRMFYFANFEQRRLDQTGLATILPENVSAINGRLSAIGYQGTPVSTGLYPNPVHSSNFLAKLDHRFNAKQQSAVRYSSYDVVSDNSRGAGGLNAVSASAGLHNVDRSVAVSDIWTLSPRTVSETRAQFAYGDLKAPPSDEVGPAVNIAGVGIFGTLSGSPTRRVNKMYEIVNNVSHQAGAHALRAGVDFLYNGDSITYPRSSRGSYSFSSLPNFLIGNYSGFSQTFGDPVVSQGNPNVGVFAQDEWRVGSRLTLNAGLRYDVQWLETINTDRNNLAPRIGIAWSPTSSQNLVVRANAGLFFDRVPLRAVANAILSAGNTTDLTRLHQPNVSGLIPAQDGAPAFPNILPVQLLTTTLVDFSTMDKNLQNAYSRQGSVEVERQIGEGRTVSVGYQYVRGVNLLMSVNQNVATCAAVGANNGCRPNAAFRNNNQYSSVASSNYHGLHVSFVQRPAPWASARLTYTLSKSMNDVGENFFSSPVDPNDIMKDWGRSDDDQRHRLVATASVSSPTTPGGTLWRQISNGFQLSTMLQYYSALPFNITSGIMSLQGTTGRPPGDGTTEAANFDVRSVTFIPRNAGVGSDFFTAGLRLTRSFALARGIRADAIAEVFNLTNRRNNLTRNATFGGGTYPTNPAPNFGQILAVGDPRTWQFALRMRF
jgi:Carboxypeptidase regulatory-like domain